MAEEKMTLDDYPHEIKNPWPVEKFNERIAGIELDIKKFNQEMNSLNRRMNELKQQKLHIQQKISKKNKYLKQLKKHLSEKTNQQEGWKEI